MDRMAATPMCVMCRTRPVDPHWRPFCSERCQLIDLGRWADGNYRVAADEPADDDDDDDNTTLEV
jgi:endogenous inhibitor of DNA gyrase (YacG/DUF329 family)